MERIEHFFSRIVSREKKIVTNFIDIFFKYGLRIMISHPLEFVESGELMFQLK